MSAEVWMGYLVDAHKDFVVVQSPFVHNGARVFGADSDATTLAVAGLLHRLQSESIESVSVPDGIDGQSLSIASGVRLHDDESNETSPWDVLMSDEATVVIAKHGANVALTPLDVEIEVDPAFNEALDAAWKTELTAAHVSQGAYVSRAQYEEAATSRLSLLGQSAADNTVWPPRYTHVVDGTPTTTHRLKRTGTVQSWTTLSAAGAPSEFSLRAPLLGGVSTVFLKLDDGPKGVFLTVDDESPDLTMDARMELVFRRLYAQEGFIRYGLKARSIDD